MARYAEGTTVSIESSQAEIARLIVRFGARRFMSGFDDDKRLAIVQFEAHNRRVKFILYMPDPSSREFTHNARGQVRNATQRDNAYQAECRRLWRSLVLVIKSKLEAVESGIETFEDAFLANIVLPSGQTVGEFIEPQIEASYRTGQMPPMLPGVDPTVLALESGRS